MRKSMLLTATLALLLIGVGAALIARPALLSSTATEAFAASAEVQIGLGVEKMELKDANTQFKVAPNTRIYAWTKVSGCADSKITIAFFKGDKEASRQELSVPRSPYRTFAFRTFRSGDAGAWTAKVMAGDKVLGTAGFQVEIP